MKRYKNVVFVFLLILFGGCSMKKEEFSNDLSELSLYADLKFSADNLKWKLMTLPENANDRNSIPGPIFEESLIICFETSEANIEAIRKDSKIHPDVANFLVPKEYLKPWILEKFSDVIRRKKLQGFVLETNGILSIEGEPLSSFAIILGNDVFVYINYRKS